MKSCENCKFCILKDFGYSNYTVEGTYVICAKDAHPDGTFDRFYGEDKRLQYADKCPHFVDGIPIEVDVECERLNDMDSDDLEIINMARSNGMMSD